MKRVVLFLLIIASSNLSALSSKKLANAINLCGKERMLSQRMTKEALLIYKGIESDKNRELLKEDSRLFQEILTGLKKGDKKLKLKATKDQKIRAQLEKLTKVWNAFHTHIGNILSSSKPDMMERDIAYLLANKDKLLISANQAVEAYVAKSKNNLSKRAQSVNLSGKLRMLTQKLSIELLENDPKQKESIKEIERILKGLKYGNNALNLQKTKLPKIIKKLDRIIAKFQNIKKESDLKKKLAMLDTLLTDTDKMTKLYAASINRERVAKALDSIVQAFTDEKAKKRAVINLAGRERMLSQRIAKDLLLDRYYKIYADDLESSKKRFISFLRALRDGNDKLPKTEDKTALEMINSLEKEINKLNKSNDIEQKLRICDTLLEKSQILVLRYKKLYASKNFMENSRLDIVDIAGRERMLSQRMTKALLAKINAIGYRDFDKELKSSAKLFEESLKALIHGDKKRGIIKPSNKKIVAQLAKVEKIWHDIKPYYHKESLSKREVKKLIPKNLALLKEMDKGVKLYEKELEY